MEEMTLCSGSQLNHNEVQDEWHARACSDCEDDDVDDGEESVWTESEDEVVQNWAAREIQRQWRRHCTRHEGHDLKASRTNDAMCCTCFAPIEANGALPGPEEPEVTQTQLFCGPCKAKLRRGLPVGATTGGTSSPMPSFIASPLPKLSLLVQAEAKCQEQLRLLRQQQDLLRQQQQEIELRKKVQADTLALEKQLARHRRREFQQLMARRHAEEAQRLQDVGEKSTTPQAPKTRAKSITPSRPRSVTAAEASSLLEPTQLRQHRIPAPPQRVADIESKAAELAERAAQDHRRKQKRESLQCYAQDLTPLIHGNKPKKLPLPPAITPQPHGASATAAKKKATKAPLNRKRKPGKIVQLAPLTGPVVSNNQYEPVPASPALRVAIPRQSYETYAMGSATSKAAAPTPLTAEIKPASWMYELMTNDPVLSSASASRSVDAFIPASHSKTQLTTLHEDDDADGVVAKHHKTPSSNGQRMILTPLASGAAAAFSSSPLTAPPAVAPAVSYSTDRLASLLQKYNVTVATSTTT